MSTTARDSASSRRGAHPDDAAELAGPPGPDEDDLDEDWDDEPGDGTDPHAPSRRWGLLLVVGSALGFLASMVLTIDRFKLLADPEAQFACDISPFVACGPVMSSAAGALFGFPNPLLGIAGFAITGTLGVMVASGVRPPRWVLLGLQLGVLAAAVFISWLQFQTLYVVNALCLWCMLVWVVTIPIAVTTTVTTMRSGALGSALQRAGVALRDWQWVLVVAWYVVVASLVVLRFYREFARYYFGVTL